MRKARVWLLSLLLAGCAGVPVAPVVSHDHRLLVDHLFAPATEPIRVADVFALSDEMRGYLETEIATQARVKGRQRALYDALYGKGQLKLEYDTERTRNAAQAFAARSGNCLSLVIMTSAFAREMGLEVEYQKVFADEAVARSGDIYLSIGHVNIVLGKRRVDGGSVSHRVGGRPHEAESTTIDFLPSRDIRSLRTAAIGEEIVVAMYLNNRSVEALAAGRTDDAYGWVRAALVHAPGYLVPYNTLAVVYLRGGHPVEAERVLAHVLAQEPANVAALSNLIPVLTELGRTTDAQRVAARLQELDPEPAFSHFKRGVAALRAGDAALAKEAFAREVARAPDYHEFHYWLGVAHASLGQTELARRHVALALENSTTRRDQELYAAKLERLDARR
jgi:tetratricopeptide (TPR) repeat protein